MASASFSLPGQSVEVLDLDGQEGHKGAGAEGTGGVEVGIVRAPARHDLFVIHQQTAGLALGTTREQHLREEEAENGTVRRQAVRNREQPEAAAGCRLQLQLQLPGCDLGSVGFSSQDCCAMIKGAKTKHQNRTLARPPRPASFFTQWPNQMLPRESSTSQP